MYIISLLSLGVKFSVPEIASGIREIPYFRAFWVQSGIAGMARTFWRGPLMMLIEPGSMFSDARSEIKVPNKIKSSRPGWL